MTVSDVVPLLPAKFKARGLDVRVLDAERFLARRAAFEDDWNRRLNYLVRDTSSSITFDAAWRTVVDVLRQIERELGEWS